MGTTSSSPYTEYDNDFELVIRWSKELERSLRYCLPKMAAANSADHRAHRRRRQRNHVNSSNSNGMDDVPDTVRDNQQEEQQEGLMDLIRRAQRLFDAAAIQDMRQLAKCK